MSSSRGISLLETIVATGIFAIVSVAIFGSFAQVHKALARSEDHVLANSLLNERMEAVRNLSYSDVGLVSGIPNGILLPTDSISRGGQTFVITTDVHYVDLPFDGIAPADLNPADQKFVSIDIDCPKCANFKTVSGTTFAGPRSLEASAGLGSLFVNVIDASGKPIPDALVHVTLASTSPIDLTDRTMTNGQLQLVGAPPAYQGYAITATKEGYTSDRTYDPNAATTTSPVLPNATVAAGQLTQVTLVIDKVSPLDVYVVDSSCSRIANANVHMRGQKLITNGGVRKFDQSFTANASGYLSLSNMEWDNYEATATVASYVMLGTNPSLNMNLTPGAHQSLYLTMLPSSGNTNDNSLAVMVRDAVTKAPISGAVVTMQRSGGETIVQQTGRGTFSQFSWSGGPLHTMLDAPDVYDSDFGFTDTISTPGIVKLSKVAGAYQSYGGINSSVVDTGSASNFFSIKFDPNSEPASTTLRFQIATAASSTGPWTFVGPDGSSGTYFNGSVVNTPSLIDGGQYLRYKAYLDTASSTVTPTFENVSITYASACIPPGVTGVAHLHNGSWSVSVSASGYQDGSDSFTLNPATPYLADVIYLTPN